MHIKWYKIYIGQKNAYKRILLFLQIMYYIPEEKVYIPYTCTSKYIYISGSYLNICV